MHYNVSKNVNRLGLRIAQARTKLGLSQNNVSDLIGISRPNYTAIENGVNGRFLKDYQLKNIARELKVSSDYLLGLVSEPNPNAEIMSIVNALGLSSDAIEFIQSLKSGYNSRNLHILNDFIKWSDTEFLESLSLYKLLKTFFDTEYLFVLEFIEDIEDYELDIYTKSEVDFSSLKSNYKYFYYNLDNVKKYFELRKKMIFKSNYTLSEAIDTLVKSLHSSLAFFTQTINSSLDFIKYRISNYFNNYLDENLEI